MKKEKREKFTKSNLPTKICETCAKPFAWRKRWEKVWAEVKYCSEKCRRSKNQKSEESKTPRGADLAN